MIRLITSRWGVAVALVIAGVAWLTVGGIVFIDSLPGKATPTLSAMLYPEMTPSATNIAILPTATSILPTFTVTPIPATPTLYQTATASATPAPTVIGGCTIPDGWVAHSVEPGDTLFGFQLGSNDQIDVAALMKGNCLHSKLLTLGQTVFLPPGAASNAPKIDDSPPSVPSSGTANLPSGPTRAANCPCVITVHEGWRLEQIADMVDHIQAGFSGHDFLMTVAAGAPTPGLAFLGSRPAGKSLEGFMFPGRYTLQNDTSAVQFRDMMLNAFASSVSGQVQADAAAHGLTFWQIIVLASVIQRESYTPSEQKLIASVFYNRLNAQKAIASTVTLQYALGRPGRWWPRIAGATINTKSPYNTYIYGGLPPTPIDSPGLGAILAAVYPAQTNYQFFSAKCGGGGNFYAATYEEFKAGLNCGS